jgi:hypothetical protein
MKKLVLGCFVQVNLKDPGPMPAKEILVVQPLLKFKEDQHYLVICNNLSKQIDAIFFLQKIELLIQKLVI